MDNLTDFDNTKDVSDAAIEWVLRVTNCDCFTAASVRRGAEDNYGADGARIIAARLIERHYPELLVDPLLVEARTIAGNTTTERGWAQWAEKGECDQTHVVRSTLAALRRGMELGLPEPLTRERVAEAFKSVFGFHSDYNTDRLHAALTASEAPDA